MKRDSDHNKLRRAAAVGRLMLGQFNDWQEFTKAAEPIEDSRRVRRANASLDRRRLAPELQRFINENFKGLSIEHLSNLYEEIEPGVGLRIDKDDFESRYARIVQPACYAPPHSTLQLSLWGLQFESPEDHLSKDIQCAYELLKTQETCFVEFKKINFGSAKKNREEIGLSVRTAKFAIRSCILSSFSLLECYLNCLAWDQIHNMPIRKSYSDKQLKKLNDLNISFEEKLTPLIHDGLSGGLAGVA